MLQYVVGDASAAAGSGIRVIVHIVNDAGKWGAGFTGALSRRWLEPERAYREWARGCVSALFGEEVPLELGQVQFVWVEGGEEDDEHYPNCGVIVANLVGQHGIRTRSNPMPLRLDAVARGLAEVRDHIGGQYSVHMPRIGTGLAGGRWEDIEPLIRRELVDHEIPVYVYDLPKRG